MSVIAASVAYFIVAKYRRASASKLPSVVANLEICTGTKESSGASSSEDTGKRLRYRRLLCDCVKVALRWRTVLPNGARGRRMQHREALCYRVHTDESAGLDAPSDTLRKLSPRDLFFGSCTLVARS